MPLKQFEILLKQLLVYRRMWLFKTVAVLLEVMVTVMRTHGAAKCGTVLQWGMKQLW